MEVRKAQEALFALLSGMGFSLRKMKIESQRATLAVARWVGTMSAGDRKGRPYRRVEEHTGKNQGEP